MYERNLVEVINDELSDDEDQMTVTNSEDNAPEIERETNEQLEEAKESIGSTGSSVMLENPETFPEEIEEATSETPDLKLTNIFQNEMNERYGERSGRYDLRDRRIRSYGHLYASIEKSIMKQINAKQGNREFGEAGIDVIMKGLKQLHDRDVFKPRIYEELSDNQRQDALNHLMFLKTKRDRTVKGQDCTNRRKQQEKIIKEEARSPTVSIKLIMLSCTINALEIHNVGIVDIPGAFMHANSKDMVHVWWTGNMVELLVRVDPKTYRNYVWCENRKSILYIELRKALYGTLKAALLFWHLLTNKLIEWGFTMIPALRTK